MFLYAALSDMNPFGPTLLLRLLGTSVNPLFPLYLLRIVFGLNVLRAFKQHTTFLHVLDSEENEAKAGNTLLMHPSKYYK